MLPSEFAQHCLDALTVLWEFRISATEHGMLLPAEQYILSHIVSDLTVLADSLKSHIDKGQLGYLQREERHRTDVWKDAAEVDGKVRRFYQTDLLRNLAQVLLEDFTPKTEHTPDLRLGKIR